MPSPLATMVRASSRAASAYAGCPPPLDPQNTHTLAMAGHCEAQHPRARLERDDRVVEPRRARVGVRRMAEELLLVGELAMDVERRRDAHPVGEALLGPQQVLVLRVPGELRDDPAVVAVVGQAAQVPALE